VANLKTLVLKNFRNHDLLQLRFGEGINLILGKNAQGKTNILESIYFLGEGKSFRANDHRDVIKWGEEDCTIEAELEKASGKDNSFAYLGRGGKAFKLNGKKKRSATGLNVVLFVPQDIIIFRNQPTERRNYLNNLLSGIDQLYRAIYKEYSRAVTQRNKILRESAEKGYHDVPEEIEVWNRLLVEKGTEVIIKRKSWIDQINRMLPGIYGYMGGVGAEAELVYRPKVQAKTFNKDDISQEFVKRLKEREELEMIRGTTLVGPHRDDWSASISGRDLKHYGSQSQMRVMALSLKVVELRLKKELLRETPLLLLDDVISELDESSAQKLLGFVNEIGGQVFLTTTDQEGVLENLGPDVNIYTVSQESWKL
jgi:DNA replication and repair protein RecF